MSLPISGFTAVPNPQMLAFMAAQSFVMMMQAGEGWQFGKRKQSAMTNEEFNKQTPKSIMERQMQELKIAIPTIEKSMNAMTPMIRTIVTQYGDFMAEIVKALPDVFKAAQGGQSLTGNISTVGQEFAQIISLLLGGIKNAVPNIAVAYGEEEKQNFFQEDQDIQDEGKISDVPISISSLTDNELKSAYFDMLKNRPPFDNLTSKQKQLLTLEYKKRFGNPKEEEINIPVEPPSPLQVGHIEWQNRLFHLRKVSLGEKGLIKQLEGIKPQSRISNAYQQWLQKYNLRVKKHKALNKLLFNHISLGRNSNNQLIKIQARQLYNQQDWKKY